MEGTSSSIPPKAFYGSSTFRPAALIRGKGKRIALKAARKDAERLLRSFPTQQEALNFCDATPSQGLRVWSYEVDNKGRRRYAIASYAAFWRFYSRCIRRGVALHLYEVLRERYACKLYFDLEFVRGCNAQANAEEMIDAVVCECGRLAGVSVRRGDASLIELDSTTDKKFSRHLIFQEIVFHDNLQAGDFARRVVDGVISRDERLMLVRKEDGSVTPFVDMGVYTRNRCFRLVGSCKFGKEQRLTPVGCNGRVAFSREYFIKSLVCSVTSEMKLRGTPTIVATGCVATGVVSTIKYGGRSERSDEVGSRNGEGDCRLKKIEEYVLGMIKGDGGGIYGVTVMGGSETVVYAIKGGYKYCARIGRHHKSNNVMLVADVARKEMYQRCFDPDCRGFRSEGWALPDWTVMDDADNVAGTEVSDEALCAMMDDVMANEAVGGG